MVHWLEDYKKLITIYLERPNNRKVFAQGHEKEYGIGLLIFIQMIE